MRKSDYAKLFTRRKNGVYQKYVNGKYIYSKDPEELYRKWQSILLNENADKIISFKKVAEEWEGEIRERVSERTWLNYKPHYENIKQHFKTSDIQTIDARMIQNYLLAAKAKNYSTTIIKTIRTILNQIFVHAVIHDYVKYNPVSDVRAPKGTSTKRYAPTDEEIYTIFKNIHQPFGFFPFLLICTGLRKAEALALTKQDINFDAKTININKALVYVDNANPSVKGPKTENGIRTVPISDILIEPLKDHMRHTSGDLLFPCPKSNRNPGGGLYDRKSL